VLPYAQTNPAHARVQASVRSSSGFNLAARGARGAPALNSGCPALGVTICSAGGSRGSQTSTGATPTSWPGGRRGCSSCRGICSSRSLAWGGVEAEAAAEVFAPHALWPGGVGRLLHLPIHVAVVVYVYSLYIFATVVRKVFASVKYVSDGEGSCLCRLL